MLFVSVLSVGTFINAHIIPASGPQTVIIFAIVLCNQCWQSLVASNLLQSVCCKHVLQTCFAIVLCNCVLQVCFALLVSSCSLNSLAVRVPHNFSRQVLQGHGPNPWLERSFSSFVNLSNVFRIAKFFY